MYNLINLFSEYYNRLDFREFQNSLTEEAYDNLGLSYTNSYNEVKTVTELCNLLNGKSFEKLSIYSKKIHGTKSYVQFKNRDKPVSTELADMVIISLVTRKNEIVYEKTSFVQNKKEDSQNKWKIDQNQLYLLKNFPSFKGTKGIFNQKFKGKSISYKNQSRTLGTYGLFQSPGDMILASADLINKVQSGKSVEFDRIKSLNIHTQNGMGFPFIGDYRMMEEMIFMYMKRLPKYGIPFMNLPFLGTTLVCYDLYDFIRNWTLFNIGEPAYAFGNTIDEQLSIFNRILFREFEGLGNLNTNIDGGEIDNNLVVFVARIELE